MLYVISCKYMEVYKNKYNVYVNVGVRNGL